MMRVPIRLLLRLLPLAPSPLASASHPPLSRPGSRSKRPYATDVLYGRVTLAVPSL